MAQILNQYSFVVSAVFLLAVVGVALLTSRQRKRAWIVLGAVALAIGLSWAAIRPVASDVGSAAEVSQAIGAGEAVLVEFQSPFWMACIQAKPIVDGIEKDQAGKLRVLRLDVQSQAGQSLASSMKFAFTPTFIFFDAKGNEIWRSVGRIDPLRVEKSLQ